MLKWLILVHLYGCARQASVLCWDQNTDDTQVILKLKIGNITTVVRLYKSGLFAGLESQGHNQASGRENISY